MIRRRSLVKRSLIFIKMRATFSNLPVEDCRLAVESNFNKYLDLTYSSSLQFINTDPIVHKYTCMQYIAEWLEVAEGEGETDY